MVRHGMLQSPMHSLECKLAMVSTRVRGAYRTPPLCLCTAFLLCISIATDVHLHAWPLVAVASPCELTLGKKPVLRTKYV